MAKNADPRGQQCIFCRGEGDDSLTKVVTLVSGHGWQYNGKTAWKGVYDRWKEDTSNWTGSNYICSLCKVTFVHNPLTTNIWYK